MQDAPAALLALRPGLAALAGDAVEQADQLAAPGEEQGLREAVLKFSREIAFSAARVYARAAESRGSWDARLQALLVDALLRGDSSDVLASRAAALDLLVPAVLLTGAVLMMMPFVWMFSTSLRDAGESFSIPPR